MRRLVYILPALLFAALLVYFFLALSRDPGVLPSAMIDKPAPDFALAGLANPSGLGRGDLAGRVVLVNFFASWCVPCRAEHPLLMRLADELHVPLYGIDYKDKPEDAARFLRELGDPYGKIGADRDGRVGIDFGVYGVPESYLIDRDGNIRYRQVGPFTEDDIQKKLMPLIAELSK